MQSTFFFTCTCQTFEGEWRGSSIDLRMLCLKGFGILKESGGDIQD